MLACKSITCTAKQRAPKWPIQQPQTRLSNVEHSSRRLSVVAAFRHIANGKPSYAKTPLENTLSQILTAVDEGATRLRVAEWKGLEVRMLLQVGQVAASLAFVVLYIWSTYDPVVRGSWRHTADMALSAVFAADLVERIRTAGHSWARVLFTPLSLLDVLSFAPGVLELCGASWLGAGLQGAGLDLRWFRIFRALRLLRLCLLTGNLPLMKLSRSALLSGAVNVRLMQLVTSVLALLFTSASLVHAVERLPWHDALYFVTTTLTTVGYGDVVVKTMAGRLIVLVFMAVGVVLIPVRCGQLWSQLASRRLTAGTLEPGKPVVLLSGRLSEVRGFADLTEEFFHQVQLQRFIPRDVHLMVLGNKPSYEFTAFQELNDTRMTLVEGSVLSAADLVRCRAEAAAAVLVLGDRFANDAASEDLDVLFRVWAIKSYTKCVPLTVQVLRASALAKVSPFLDPHQDVVMSVEQMRHRLLALSALCPGASTLLGNLLHTAGPTREIRDSVFRPPGSPPPKVAGRTWFAEYVRGCGHDLHVVPVRGPRTTGPNFNSNPTRGTGATSAAAGAGAAARPTGTAPAPGGPTAPRGGGREGLGQEQEHGSGATGGGGGSERGGAALPGGVSLSLAGCSFGSVVSAAFQKRHLLVIGVLSGEGLGRVSLNPPHYRRLLASDQLVVIAHGGAHAEAMYDEEVVAAAAAATRAAAEAAAAAAAAAQAEAAAAAAAAADERARVVAAIFGASGGGGGGGGNGSSGESSETEGSMTLLTMDAVWTDGGGVSVRRRRRKGSSNSSGGNGSGSDAGGGTGSGGSQRVKRYFPSLASWDEDMPALSGGNEREGIGAGASEGQGADDLRHGGEQAGGGGGRSWLDVYDECDGPAAVPSELADAGINGVARQSGGHEVGRVPAMSGSTVETGAANASTATGSGSVDVRDAGTAAGADAVRAPPAAAAHSAAHSTGPGSGGGLVGSGSISGGGGGGAGAGVGVGYSVDCTACIHSGAYSASFSTAAAAASAAAAISSGVNGATSAWRPHPSASGATSAGVAAAAGPTAAAAPSPASASAPTSPAYISAATTGAFQAVGHNPPVSSSSTVGRPYALADAPWRQPEVPMSTRRGHIILAGAIDSFVEFARVLHSCAGMRDPESGVSSLEVVLLHPSPPEATVLALGAMGPTRVVRGSPADPRALEQAGAARARCLVYLGHSERPSGPRDTGGDAGGGGGGGEDPSSTNYGTTSQAGVQADAEALLTCYGVGEEAIPSAMEISTDGYGSCGEESLATLERLAQQSTGSGRTTRRSPDTPTATAGGGGAAAGGDGGFGSTARDNADGGKPTGSDDGSSSSSRKDAEGGGDDDSSSFFSGAVRGHSVVELSFTSSVRFLQPGLLLQGTSVWDESCSIGGPAATPRRSWRQRHEAEVAAAQHGLVQWQTNIYYGAGRVVVPALVDTFTIQAFAKRNLLLDVMSELCGDDGRPHGTPLRLLPVPREMAGRPYRELFDAAVTHGSIPLGLYRSKSENPAWRLHFVSTNPAWEDVVSHDDKVFVLRGADSEPGECAAPW